jgi:two-component system, OmpR family, alkaline phosphatase synthesis response regulator PhoP
VPKILIIEDQQDLANGLEINFKKNGYETLKAGTGELGLSIATNEAPDLIILDVMLPDISGLDVCLELRKRSINIPILMLTAKADEIDRVVGLEVGADDYVTKPFSIRELLARVRAHLRRRILETPAAPTQYAFGNASLDFVKYEAWLDGKPLQMTQKEFELMRYFIRHRGKLVTRDQILREIWGFESFPNTRTVDMHISKLRRKFEEDPSNPKYLLSVYGEGYKFVG